MSQSGAQYPFEIRATLDARDSGIIEVLAPNADLTASGKFLAGPTGCVGSFSRRCAGYERARERRTPRRELPVTISGSRAPLRTDRQDRRSPRMRSVRLSLHQAATSR